MLTLSSNEKDYLLRGEEQSISQLHETAGQLKTHISEAALTNSEENRLLTLIMGYEDFFEQLIEKDALITEGIGSFQDAASR